MNRATPDRVVGAHDARTHFSELLKRVESGEEITITRHGAPVARLIPIKRSVTPSERADAIKRWRDMSGHLTLKGLKVKHLREEGRK